MDWICENRDLLNNELVNLRARENLLYSMKTLKRDIC